MRWILNLLRRRRVNRELADEVEAHIDEKIEELIETGLGEEEARQRARREFGNAALCVETSREAWGWTSLERLGQDVRYAVRTLRKSPGFTLTAILCLALGIGANTAIFSLIDAALLRMLPVRDPERLMVMGGRPFGAFSYPQFVYLREHARTLALVTYGRVDLNLSAGEVTEGPTGQVVSDNYFSVLGVQPAFGRSFAQGEEAVAMLSYRFWLRRFGGDPGVIGRTINLNGLPFTVIGITPRPFFGMEVGTSPDVFVPIIMRDRLMPGRSLLTSRNNFWLTIIGRLQPGVSKEEARAEAQVLHHQGSAEQTRDLPADHGLVRMFRNMQVTLAPGYKGVGGFRTEFEKPLLILMTVVALVLLIACANVAALLLARATSRQREIAVRLALGAGRARLLRQLLTESLVLSIAAGVLGLLLAHWSAVALVGFLNDRIIDVTPDARILGFTLAVSVLTGLLFGVAPATLSTRQDLATAMKGEGSTTLVRARRLELRNLLVAGQVAISLLLVIGAGLFLRTLANLKTIDTGFYADHVLLVSLNPGLSRYSPGRILSFYDQLLERASGLPGVRSASLADSALLAGAHFDGMAVEGQTVRPEEQPPVAIKTVTPRFFETMGIALRLGRDFTPADRAGAPKVAIVNEAFSRKYFSGQSPIGKRIGVGAKTPGLEIIGVIADTKYRYLRGEVPITVYLSLNQAESPLPARTLHVRTSIDPENMIAAIQEQIHTLDKELPILKVSSFSKLIDAQLVKERLIAALSGFFGGLALLLASIGLYGVVAYNVERRTREIGIRMSLGASRDAVRWMVLRDCLRMAAVGVAIGLPLSFWLARFVSNQLYGVSPGDLTTIAVATFLLVAVVALAGYVPARRASRVDPMVALRYE